METALVITVPEAEGLVGHWRETLDPSAADGMPAHVTLAYPFRDGAKIGRGTEAALAGIFLSASAFDLTFEELERFPRVLWLAPRNPKPFKVLEAMLRDAFPELRPAHDFVPHLTLAHLADDDREQLGRIERGFLLEAGDRMPLRTRVEEAVLMERGENGRWAERRRFRLSR